MKTGNELQESDADHLLSRSPAHQNSRRGRYSNLDLGHLHPKSTEKCSIAFYGLQLFSVECSDNGTSNTSTTVIIAVLTMEAGQLDDVLNMFHCTHDIVYCIGDDKDIKAVSRVLLQFKCTCSLRLLLEGKVSSPIQVAKVMQLSYQILTLVWDCGFYSRWLY